MNHRETKSYNVKNEKLRIKKDSQQKPFNLIQAILIKAICQNSTAILISKDKTSGAFTLGQKLGWDSATFNSTLYRNKKNIKGIYWIRKKQKCYLHIIVSLENIRGFTNLLALNTIQSNIQKSILFLYLRISAQLKQHHHLLYPRGVQKCVGICYPIPRNEEL